MPILKNMYSSGCIGTFSLVTEAGLVHIVTSINTTVGKERMKIDGVSDELCVKLIFVQ